DLALPTTAPGAPAVSPAPTQEPDRAQIVAALERNGGVLAQAASELGFSRQALYRRMERHGIPRGGGD
ncbi:helix-turn-helix domain-containing protein, partial [Luteimonas sp. 8-5]|uniref:helix-turn-helix domain-containing protein n=1 Tax=Luteimonas sp. 8-5 TaxID=3039387 RepID=UPI0024366BFE